MRRIKATLQQPGDNLGYVKVAVYTYIYLLAHAVDDTSSYSPSFFAREIVSGPDAVVSTANIMTSKCGQCHARMMWCHSDLDSCHLLFSML